MQWLSHKLWRHGHNSHTLADDLYAPENRATSNFSGGTGDYWPGPVIDMMIQDDVVRRELHISRLNPRNELVSFIVNDAKRLFTLVVVSLGGGKPGQLLEIMRIFHRNKVSDAQVSAEITDTTYVGPGRQRGQYLDLDKLTKLTEGAVSRPLLTRLFDDQWKIFVPVLSTECASYSFASQAILPFTTLKMVDEGRGAFSKVQQVEIHSGYIKDAAHPVCSPLLDLP